MPPVNTNNLTINKTDKGINHTPAGNPVTVPNGGTVKACNKKKKGKLTVRVTMNGETVFEQTLEPGQCTTLIMGSPQLPDGQYTVEDPPAIVKIIGTSGNRFTFLKPKKK